ncbi:MAG TPA: MotA/TolQ/ExbB proton channel family protein [Devosia sp.]|nr:MotA/TolQ/ExbB proton channel family protein [Devosia sp.]
MTASAEALARAPRDRSFDAVFRWGVFFALICLAAVVLWDFGYLLYIYAADTSQISAVITVIFVGFSFYCLYLLLSLAPELRAIGSITAQMQTGSPIVDEGGVLRAGTYKLPPKSAVAEHLRDVLLKYRNDPEGDREVLLQSMASPMRARIRIGMITADVLYKLGLLGTVIGFIVMLGSISQLGEFEVETMRGAMQAMSSGMAISLLTTVTGLVCGTLLRMQFVMVEGVVSQILRRTVRLTEVFIIPDLKKAAARV